MTTTLTVRIKSLDHRLADEATRQLIQLARTHRAHIRGPVPLPVTEGRLEPDDSQAFSPQPSHRGPLFRRLLTLSGLSEDAVVAIANINLPAGVQTRASLT